MTPSPDPLDRLRLVLPSDYDSLDRIVDESDAFMAAHSTDDEFNHRVVLLTSEAATNAIEHGNRLEEDKTIELDLAVYPDRVDVTVLDQGSGFDRSAVADPLEEDNLLSDGGRGLFLIESLADEVHFEMDGRRIRMSLRRPE